MAVQLTGFFIELSILLIIVLLILVVVRALKQPIIIGYILSAILVSPLVFGLVSKESFFEPLAKVGIALLLFMVGLELNPRIIKKIGKVALITGLGQIIFTFSTGFFIASLLGFSLLASIYIAIALTFSSTIFVMKLLVDRDEKETISGKIATGILIVQDIVHIIAIIFLLALGKIIQGSQVPEVALATFGWTLLMGVLLTISGIYILPSVTRFVAKSQELLLFFCIGWALIVATIFNALNLSFEIGALLAGVVLSLSPYRYEFSSKTKPFRDFFLLIFFIYISTQIVPLPLDEFLVPILFFSALVLIGNPFIIMVLMGIMNYTKKNSFITGVTLAQISEFSLIIVGLGVQAGHISSEVLSVSVIVALITIAGSSYSITYSRKLYKKLAPYLSIFERRGHKIDEGKHYHKRNFDTVLFGYNRIGYSLLKSLKKTKSKFLVVDYNPDTIKSLVEKGISCRYGDADDLELLEELPLRKVKTIISTVPDIETNTVLIDYVKNINPDANIIVVSHNIDNTLELYDIGATYVITPHFLGGNHVANLLEKHKTDKKKFEREGKKARKELLERKKEGHAHD